MLRRVLAAAIVAGTVAGVFVSAVQALKIVPLIVEAESYEAAGPAAAASHVGHEAPASVPSGGLERGLFTALANVVTAIGFALLLAACFALRGDVDWRRGVIWGLAGFAVFHLAPALGLPPEPPGVSAAPLLTRQAWWLATVAATAAGLGLVAFAPDWALKALGLVAIALPHAFGAPQPEAYAGGVPAELAARFAAASLATAGVFWAVLGGLSGYFFRRFAAGPERGSRAQ